jgi:hypothetical protein
MKKLRKQLDNEGWLRQFVADGALADEVEKVYNLLGFEILRLPVRKPWLKKAISFSPEKPSTLCEVIYVRPKKQEGNEDEDWG